jgi:hypothetical protein
MPTEPSRQKPRQDLPMLTDRHVLGTRGLEVSPFCLGIVGAPEVVCAAFDAGINFFFVTADMHWPLYENTRRGLEMLLDRGGSIRDEIVVGVVSYSTQPEFNHAPFEELLGSVRGLQRIDVAIAGGAYANDILGRLPIYQFRHRRQAFLGTRAIGCSFHDRVTGLLLTNHGMVDISFIRYNAGHPGARNDFFPLLAEAPTPLLYNFKSTMGYVPPALLAKLEIASNQWIPRPTDHYRFVLTRPEFDGILCSLGRESMVTELVDALAEGPLSEDEEQYLLQLAAGARRLTGQTYDVR